MASHESNDDIGVSIQNAATPDPTTFMIASDSPQSTVRSSNILLPNPVICQGCHVRCSQTLESYCQRRSTRRSWALASGGELLLCRLLGCLSSQHALLAWYNAIDADRLDITNFELLHEGPLCH